MLFGGKIELGAVHTYLELFARYFIDLTPQVALIAAVSADREGNLYTGPNTEDTPTVVEATAFKDGVVIAQVNELVDQVPRVDIPADRGALHHQVGQAVLRGAAVHARSRRHHRRLSWLWAMTFVVPFANRSWTEACNCATCAFCVSISCSVA